MKIVWFTWKDKTHPQAGGAEIVNEELAKRLVKDGHTVLFIVGGYKNSKKEEIIDGYKIIRLGNRFTLYILACIYYLENLRNWPDLIIEEINTIPFLTQFYAHQKRVLLFYQLCRQIWFYQFFFPLNYIGYFLEPLYLLIMRKNKTLTESLSTKKDLQKYGFKNVHIFPIGIDTKPLSSASPIKYSSPTLLSLGNIRKMKRTLDQIKAFEKAKVAIPKLKLKIAGDSNNPYGKEVLTYIRQSPYKKDIEYLGKVSHAKKREIMKKSHAILVTSVKEGWGLIVTEAASQGTPAIVYNADGLRDSVIDQKTGLISRSTPENLALKIEELFKNKNTYRKLQKNGLEWSKKLTFENSYKVFKKILFHEK